MHSRRLARLLGMRFVDRQQNMRSYVTHRRFRRMEGDGDDDGDVGGGGGGGGASGGAGGSGGGSGGDDGNKTFTQEELNSIVKREKTKLESKYKEQTQKQLDELNKMRDAKDLTEAQRKKLDDRAAALEAELMTEREKAEAEKKRSQTKHQQELEATKTEAKQWQGLYEKERKDTAIMSAASKHKAFNPDQLLALVSPLTHVVQRKNDKGEVIPNSFETVVQTAVEEDGKFVEKQLSVDKYVEYLKGRKEYANLFVSDRPGGTGYRPGSGDGSGSKDMSAKDKIKAGLKAQQTVSKED